VVLLGRILFFALTLAAATPKVISP